jgi:hypothetical protein
MGFLKNLFGGPPGIDSMRLDILMDYRVGSGYGSAALRWHDMVGGGDLLKGMLVALLYGRILCVHKETRTELFAKVDALARENVRTEGKTGFEFGQWVLHVGLGGGDHTLWPWDMKTPIMAEPKVYSAVLKIGTPSSAAPSGRSINLTMAFGMERVLAPSSALIAIAGFSRECDQETRYLLALRMWQMNIFWGTPDRISAGTEALAYAAADQAIRSGQLRVP